MTDASSAGVGKVPDINQSLTRALTRAFATVCHVFGSAEHATAQQPLEESCRSYR
jgi:hypothetical protein